MALVPMSRVTLVAMGQDKQKIYDEIVRLGCLHISECKQIEYDANFNSGEEQRLIAEMDTLTRTMQVLSTIAGLAKNDKKSNVKLPAASFARPKAELDVDTFFHLKDDYLSVKSTAEEICRLNDEMNDCLREADNTEKKRQDIALYLPLQEDPATFQDTPHAYLALATVPNNNVNALTAAFAEQDLAAVEVVGNNNQETLVAAYCHKSLSEFWLSLSKFGFRRVVLDELPKSTDERLRAEVEKLNNRAAEINAILTDKVPMYSQLKLMYDWLNLCYKVCQADDNCGQTAYTFVLSAHTPTERKDEVQQALLAITTDIIVQCDEVEEDEQVPTLCRNNKVVQPFESVTNMYMPPNYHEPDPNPVMSVFYFLIFGLMTADVGYGLLLAVAGLALSAAIKQQTGMKKLAGLIGICGFSTMLWGFLFGSFFSVPMNDWFGDGAAKWFPILPSPSDYPIVTMVLSLLLGIIHLMAGVLCKGYKEIKQGKVLDGILDSMPWIIFFIGLIVLAAQPAAAMIATDDLAANCQQVHIQALVRFAKNATLGNTLIKVGLYTIVGALVIVAFTAGRHNKGFFGKIKGGFGGVYGVINYFSDVVSYVRIFGLMLSGAVFGAIINQIVAEMLFPAGVIGWIGGAVVLVIFHIFNLALAVLGAYVHNARLQYVEFFGKFYDGEGILFTPLGSDLDYTIIKTKPVLETVKRKQKQAKAK